MQFMRRTIVFDLLALHHGSRLGEALNFFIYDTLKIFLFLTTIIFIAAIIRSSPSRENQTNPLP